MAYIEGIGAISPQNSFPGKFPFDVQGVETPYLSCLEPNYKDFINPRASRRMSRIIKMAVTASLIALKDAALQIPEGIIVGSGLGCVAETEKFLSAMITDKEKFLNPASFIYSTHNTIASQIALLLQCKEYNQTYLHGQHSFESALLDALMLIREKSSQNVLIGGVDEMTPNLYAITKRFGLWKKNPINNLKLIDSGSKGSIPGEGASFFVLSHQKGNNSYARVKGISTVFNTDKHFDIQEWLIDFLSRYQVEVGDLDLCLLGKNGDITQDGVYVQLESNLLKNCPCGFYKQLCGEYYTANSFAVWLAANILKSQFVTPEILNVNQTVSTVRNVLIYNQSWNRNHSLILMKSCR